MPHVYIDMSKREAWVADDDGRVLHIERPARKGEKMIDVAARALNTLDMVRTSDYMLLATGSKIRRCTAAYSRMPRHSGGVHAPAISRILNEAFQGKRTFQVSQHGPSAVLVSGKTAIDMETMRALQQRRYRCQTSGYDLIVHQ